MIKKTPDEKVLVFEIRWDNEDGTFDIWKYDLRKTKNGPVETINGQHNKDLKKKKKK